MWIQNSTFIRGMSREQGGAMLVKNTNLNVRFSNFIQNYAKDGGAIALICSPSITCKYDVDSNEFNSNYATTKGGAIYYNKHRPQIFQNNVFKSGNYAPYGPELAGYPYSVIVKAYDNIPLASGQAYQGLIKVGIIDADVLYALVQLIKILKFLENIKFKLKMGQESFRQECSNFTLCQEA
ncbi:UNKNOWN [Stylonychia lemnae]|uniref:Right handed beta helix domain-containing protein n=1 Tax=Stylonychia lemnae TaxID=5949 RepID=A0A078A296_STYLE|nr:UNKNOWN [Stylonychia lemnae]|eukprot:CDW75942.1 UNKNOWN [Stylonychia lemnae]